MRRNSQSKSSPIKGPKSPVKSTPLKSPAAVAPLLLSLDEPLVSVDSAAAADSQSVSRWWCSLSLWWLTVTNLSAGGTDNYLGVCDGESLMFHFISKESNGLLESDQKQAFVWVRQMDEKRRPHKTGA